MEELIHRRTVKPCDLNSSNRLFGGQVLSWIDEMAAAYVIAKLDTKAVVTAKISEASFIRPAMQGDLLEFHADIIKWGHTSVTVRVRVSVAGNMVVVCNLVFVAVDANGKPTPHHCGS